jgi:hypothetical protein
MWSKEVRDAEYHVVHGWRSCSAQVGKYAKAHNESLNGLVRKLLEQAVQRGETPGSKSAWGSWTASKPDLKGEPGAGKTFTMSKVFLDTNVSFVARMGTQGEALVVVSAAGTTNSSAGVPRALPTDRC